MFPCSGISDRTIADGDWVLTGFGSGAGEGFTYV